MGQSLLALVLFVSFLAVAFGADPGLDTKDCKKKKECLFLHEDWNKKNGKKDCENDQDKCGLIISYGPKTKNDTVPVTMKAKPSGDNYWAAMAFSKDELMGNDYVIYCDFKNGKVWTAYNPPRKMVEEKAGGKKQWSPTPTEKVEILPSKKVEDGICEFDLPVDVPTNVNDKFTNEADKFKNINEGYFILFSWGTERRDKQDNLKHHKARGKSTVKINIAAAFETEEKKSEEAEEPKKTTAKSEEPEANKSTKAPTPPTKRAASASAALFSSFLSLATFATLTTFLSFC